MELVPTFNFRDSSDVAISSPAGRVEQYRVLSYETRFTGYLYLILIFQLFSDRSHCLFMYCPSLSILDRSTIQSLLSFSNQPVLLSDPATVGTLSKNIFVVWMDSIISHHMSFVFRIDIAKFFS